MADEEYGFIVMSRKLYETDRFWLEPRVFSRHEAWEDLIQTAAWKAHGRMVKDVSIELARGEVLVSIRFLAERWNWGVKQVRLFLQLLLSTERIRAQRETQAGTVYLLVNYDTYQLDSGKKGTAKGGTRAQRGHSEGTKRSKGKEGEGTNKWREAPPNWQPNESHRDLAARFGLRLEYEVIKFRNHTFKEWRTDADRTFTQWLVRAAEMRDRDQPVVAAPKPPTRYHRTRAEILQMFPDEEDVA